MNTPRPAYWDSSELIQRRLSDGVTPQEEREAERAALARELKTINARLKELRADIRASHGDSALASARRELKALKKALTDRLRELEYGELPAPGLQPEAAPSAYAGTHWGTSSATDLPFNDWFPPLFK
ncbi:MULTISPECIES: hypothetical protein [Corynebacterium]|uniref:hypothetical protein n=1 Tax=Corynebacterium TaxID=1716 RepID=UPI000FACE360|nr:hypothetical protein [Corynebacterium hadale]WKC59542.1 hypothetical protein CHAD_03215 [Corynebacterium hadale]VDG62595.1 Uncharacterised protein [Streptococcus thermophilus]